MIVDIAINSISGVITALVTLFIVWRQLKADKGTSLFGTTRDSFLDAQKITYTKKIEAAEILWENVLNIRYDIPSIVNYMDFLTLDEYVTMDKKWLDKEQINLDISSFFSNQLKHFKSVERIKIHLDTKLWGDFNFYYFIINRIVYLVSEGKINPTKYKWYEEENICNLIKNALGQNSLHEMDQKKIGKVAWLQLELEWKILSSLKKFVSVEQLEKESLERAKKLDNEIAKIQGKSKEWSKHGN